MARRREGNPSLPREEAETALRERMKSAIIDGNTNASRIAEWSGYVSNAVLSNQLSQGKMKVSALSLLAILEYIPDLSAEWLMRGEGSVMRDKATSKEEQSAPPTSPAPSADSLDRLQLAEYKRMYEDVVRELDKANERIRILLERMKA